MVKPFEVVHVEMIGPWEVKFTVAGKKIQKEVRAIMMVDREIGWPEISSMPIKKSKVFRKLFGNVWFCCYPRPRKVIHGNGTECTSFEFQEMCSSYGVQASPITVKNSRRNSVAESKHLTMGNVLSTMVMSGDNWEEDLDRSLQYVA